MLVIFGAALLVEGVVDGALNILDDLDAGATLIAASVIILSGAVTWVVQVVARNRVHTALLGLASEITRGAASVSKSGGDFQSAMRDLPLHVKSFIAGLSEEKGGEQSH
jgi:hypothetical protein